MNRDIIQRNARLLLGLRGMSQQDLATLMGVSRKRIGQMWDRPTAYNMAAMAGALGVPVEWLEDEHLAEKSARELRGE